MAKYTCEIDSETKGHKFYIDGQEVPADEFSIGCYQYYDECDPTVMHKSYYISAGQILGRDRWNHSISWNSRDNSVTMTDSHTTIANTIRKAVEKAWSNVRLLDSIAKLRRKNV